MKLKFIVISVALFLIAGSSQLFAKSDQLATEKDKLSYSIGLSIGQNFKQQTIEVNIDPLMKGIEDALNEREPLMTNEEIKQTMDLFRKEMTAKIKQRKEALAEKNFQKGQEFLKDNAQKKGVITTESGLQYKILKKGTGPKPKLDDTVVTNYKGTLLNGQVFDSSYKRGKPAEFPVNGVIKGWTEALQLMETGSKWQLFIPANLAYGERGAGNAIGPNETLIFEIELLSIK